MAMMRRITEINGEIIVVETMIIVGEIVLITVQINGELVRYEILSVRQLWEGRQGLLSCGSQVRILHGILTIKKQNYDTIYLYLRSINGMVSNVFRREISL